MVRCNKADGCSRADMCPHGSPHEPITFTAAGWDGEVVDLYRCDEEEEWQCGSAWEHVICVPVS